MCYILLTNNLCYQYIMEQLIERLNHINIFLDIIQLEKRTDIETKINPQITKIDDIITEIENKISCHTLTKEEFQKLQVENKKTKIISKSLFPYYWALNENMENLTN